MAAPSTPRGARLPMETNYDILGVADGAGPKEVQAAFRRLALKHHSDRGGDTEQFKRIKQAYEDLKRGKRRPDTDEERARSSRVYSGDDEEQVRQRNLLLAREVSGEMRHAQEWAAALGRARGTGTRLFGSRALGEMEFERAANGALTIKGNIMAGSLEYDGPVLVRGNITSPTFGGECATRITLTRGDFKFVDPVANKYKVDNGARLVAERGNIVVGNVFGRKIQVQDPDGRVGLYTTVERRTHLHAPLGKIVAENVVNTVSLSADTVMALNLEDDVRVSARDVLVYGSKMTYDVRIELRRGGTLRFFERNSVLGLSDDAVVSLDNGKELRVHDLKTRKISDLPAQLLPAGASPSSYPEGSTMVGGGFPVTYEMIDNFEMRPEGRARTWRLRLGLGG